MKFCVDLSVIVFGNLRTFCFLFIVIALEFMLNRAFEPEHVAMLYVHPEVDPDSYQAYVQLHLSSEKPFEWNVR